MNEYQGLAKIYDYMMSGVDYEAWADYILEAAESFGLCPRSVLDLACGTGSTTLPLAKRGLKATGIDLAPAMLEIARRKRDEQHQKAYFIECNMLDLSFKDPFDMVVSFQDGINYLTGEGDFLKLSKAVSSCLKPGGLFMFDLNRVSHYSDSDSTVIDLPDMYLVYENNYNSASRIWHIKLTGFLRNENNPQYWEKFEEIHEEVNHDYDDVCRDLEAGGLKIQALWRMFYKEPAVDRDNRVLVIARKEE